jgi:hypothetical protein
VFTVLELVLVACAESDSPSWSSRDLAHDSCACRPRPAAEETPTASKLAGQPSIWARARRPDFSSSAKGFARFLPPVVRPSCFGSAVEAGDGATEVTLIMT